jgi:hypothetical protein
MTVENIENVENATNANAQPSQPSSWFGHTAQPQEKKEPNKSSEQKLDTALEQKQEAPKEEKKVETNNFEKRYLDTRKAFQKTKNKTLYANGQLNDIEADILTLREYLGGADIDDDVELKAKFDALTSKINDGKRILTTDDIDLSDVEDIAKKITEELETTEEEKLLKEIDAKIKAKIDDYSEFKKDNELKDKIDAFYQLFNKSSEEKQKEYLVMLKTSNIADIIDFMAEEGGDYIQNVVSPIKKHGNATQYINSLTKTIEKLEQENKSLKQDLEKRGTSSIASLKSTSNNNLKQNTTSASLGWFGR